jgi:hypothetical protein
MEKHGVVKMPCVIDFNCRLNKTAFRKFACFPYKEKNCVRYIALISRDKY